MGITTNVCINMTYLSDYECGHITTNVSMNVSTNVWPLGWLVLKTLNARYTAKTARAIKVRQGESLLTSTSRKELNEHMLTGKP